MNCCIAGVASSSRRDLAGDLAQHRVPDLGDLADGHARSLAGPRTRYSVRSDAAMRAVRSATAIRAIVSLPEAPCDCSLSALSSPRRDHRAIAACGATGQLDAHRTRRGRTRHRTRMRRRDHGPRRAAARSRLPRRPSPTQRLCATVCVGNGTLLHRLPTGATRRSRRSSARQRRRPAARRVHQRRGVAGCERDRARRDPRRMRRCMPNKAYTGLEHGCVDRLRHERSTCPARCNVRHRCPDWLHAP